MYCLKENVKASREFQEKALEDLKKKKNLSNFGNAGAVELLVKNSIQKATSRKKFKPGEKVELIPLDLSEQLNVNDDPLKKLNSLYRVDKIRKKLEELKIT